LRLEPPDINLATFQAKLDGNDGLYALMIYLQDRKRQASRDERSSASTSGS
jgi:hypothetical protein